MPTLSVRIRTLLTMLTTGGLLAGVAAMFWYQDWQYAQPTARPAGLRQPLLGTPLDVPALKAHWRPGQRPLVLHFFNPECPCSRFNLEHVRELQRQFAGRTDFVAVLQGDASPVLEEAFRRTKSDMPFLVDTDGALASQFGVYATPQAVVLDRQGRLHSTLR